MSAPNDPGDRTQGVQHDKAASVLQAPQSQTTPPSPASDVPAQDQPTSADEATQASSQLTPRSYAQIASIPPISTNAVIWPVRSMVMAAATQANKVQQQAVVETAAPPAPATTADTAVATAVASHAVPNAATAAPVNDIKAPMAANAPLHAEHAANTAVFGFLPAAPTGLAAATVPPHAAIATVLQVDDGRPMPPTPILGPTTTALDTVDGSLRLPPPAFSWVMGQYTSALNTPILRPTTTSIEDIEDPFVLPPPARPWANISRMDNGGLNPLSPLPSSSPISFPSTLSSNPGQSVAASVLQANANTFSNDGALDNNLHEEFWAQLATPVITDSNLPSALQSPAILTPRLNDSIPVSQWPPANQACIPSTKESASEDENVPPTPCDPLSHPPVASRYRKRRRGTSPPAGERASKLARRRNKGKGIATPPRSNFPSSSSNPWAASSSTSRTANSALLQSSLPSTSTLPYSSPLPSSSLASSNHTPYSDFGRRASSTTSFYNRMNMSGSFPTPHRLSDSPLADDAFSAPILTRDLSTDVSAPALPTRANGSILSTLRSSYHEDRRDDSRAEPATLPMTSDSRQSRPVSSRSAAREGAPHLPLDPTAVARRRLRESFPIPFPPDARRRAFHRPTVEDCPEEGELEDARSSGFGDLSRGPSRSSFVRASPGHNASSLPPVCDPDTRGQSGQSRWGRQTTFNDDLRSISQPRDNDAMDERLSRSSSRMSFTDNERTTATPRPLDVPSNSRPPSNPRHAFPIVHRTVAASRTPTVAAMGLDIFDIGTDDNMPAAVRRGGADTETEDASPTPIPHDGDPEVHQLDPESHLHGLSDDWIQEVWADPAGTSITLRTYNPRFTRSYGTNRRTASDIRQAIASITGESSFLVIAPDQAPHHRGYGPVEWAVTGLTTSGVDLLLRRRVWSLKFLTFFPRRRTLENPRLLLALEGFLDDNVDNIQNAVRSTFERPQIRRRIEQMIQANPEYSDIPAAEAMRRVMSSLRVSVYTLDNGTVVANVFLRSPTQSIRVWRLWVQELREVTFGSYHTAIARARRTTTCAGCSGGDHPSHLCPFVRMQGWNGPDAAGGFSYSVDGRERRDRQSSHPRDSQLSDSSRPARSSQAARGQTNARLGPAHQGPVYGGGSLDERDQSRGRGQAREHGRSRNHDQGGQGQARRRRGDSPFFSKGTRDSFHKDGRR